MNRDRAARESTAGVAVRTKDNGTFTFWDGERYWTQIESGLVKKWGGNGRAERADDWRPLADDCAPIESTTWEKKGGEPGPPGWKSACAGSPVGRAVRRDASEMYMVRDAAGTTWIESPHDDTIRELRSGFRHYSGWEPMPAGHPLAACEQGTEFRNPERPPATVPAGEVDEWARTGSSPSMEKHKARCDAEIAEHNGALAMKNGHAPRSRAFEQLVPNQQVLDQLGPMTTGLADSIKAMVEIGENEVAKGLAEKLGHLVSNASWLLREDRRKYA